MRKHSLRFAGRRPLEAVVLLTLFASCARSPSKEQTRTGAPVAAGARAAAAVPTASMQRSQAGAPERNKAAVSAPGAMIPSSAMPGRPADAALSSLGDESPGGSRRVDAAVTAEPIAAADPSGTMLVRQGQASVEVRRLDDGVKLIRQAAGQLGGFVANTTLLSGRDERHTATLEVRVPSGNFDALLAALSSLGKVESISTAVEDVGGEFVDLEAREANARRMEARLLEMLNRRTGKLSEFLSVEQELRRVREEIERYDARLKWLGRRTALSSLAVTIHEPLPLIEREPGPGPLAEAFARAWERAIAVVAFCIAALGVLLPLTALGAAGYIVARRWLKPGAPPGVSGV